MAGKLPLRKLFPNPFASPTGSRRTRILLRHAAAQQMEPKGGQEEFSRQNFAEMQPLLTRKHLPTPTRIDVNDGESRRAVRAHRARSLDARNNYFVHYEQQNLF